MTITESLAYSWQHILAIFTYHTTKLRMNPYWKKVCGFCIII